MSPQSIIGNVTPELQERLHKAYSIALLIGAGVSVDSGIPIFHGFDQMGYFEGFPPVYLCSREMIDRSPAQAWRFFQYLYNIVAKAEPNHAHKTLARWQSYAARRRVVKFYAITTNFDGLLSKAGLNSVIELYGNINRARCLSCQATLEMSAVKPASLPPHCICGGALEPDIVLLNDICPQQEFDEAITAIRGCELFIVIGSSGVHKQSMNLVCAVRSMAKNRDLTLIEINPHTSYLTPYVDFVLRGSAAELLPQFQYGFNHGDTEDG